VVDATIPDDGCPPPIKVLRTLSPYNGRMAGPPIKVLRTLLPSKGRMAGPKVSFI